MKYVNLFHDTIEHYPELLTTVFAAAKPWFPNSSLQGNVEPPACESLENLCDEKKMTPINAINSFVVEQNPILFSETLFFWCEGTGQSVSLHCLAYTEDSWKNNKEHPYKYSVVSGSLFSFQPELGEAREVKFMKEKMESAWGDPEMYDIAISFAAPERDYVRELANYLKERNVLVFFDEFEQAEMWGQDGLEYLQKAYVEKARYVVVCISAAYMERSWPTYERKQILGREFIKQDSAILPLRFDDIGIPSLPPQYFHLDARSLTPAMVGAVIIEKLTSS